MQSNDEAIAAAVRQTMKKATNPTLNLPTSRDPDKFCMTVKQLAERMQVSLPIAYNLTHSEGFPIILVGRKRLIPIASFERWLEQQTNEG